MIRIPSPADVTDDVAARFREEGFLVVDRLVDDDVVDEIRAAYDELIEGQVAARGDRLLGDLIRQVKHPSKDHPFFESNGAIDAGAELARRLFGRPRLTKVYEMLIDKPGGTPHETPWHQDVGYFGKPVAAPGTRTDLDDVQIWLALDPVDVDNGCMQFVPRKQGAPSLAHRVASGDADDEGRLIELDEPIDTATAVACPLQPGGCTVHLVGTPHYTGANLTDRPRRAYIFNIGPRAMAEASEQALASTWGDSARL